ncbi:MAG: DUF3795 domain-containing protein [Acidobacteriota bacterium]
MSDINYTPPCGLYCGDCEYLGKQCKGCGYVEGKPFWTIHVPTGICPIHDCCRNQKELEHCGLCEELPCKIFLELRDPDISDEDFERSLKTREEALRRRAEIGTNKWLQEISGK